MKKEATMARAIYKRMEIGKAYTTRELFNLLGLDDYIVYNPEAFYMSTGGLNVNKVVAAEMWKVVKTGYAKTEVKEERLANVRGLRYGSKPTSYTTYTVRYWIRVK